MFYLQVCLYSMYLSDVHGGLKKGPRCPGLRTTLNLHFKLPYSFLSIYKIKTQDHLVSAIEGLRLFLRQFCAIRDGAGHMQSLR